MTVEEIEQYIETVGTEIGPDFGRNGLKGGIRTQQVPDEIGPCIYALMSNGGVNSYCEVGCAAGGTAFLFHHFLRPAIMVLVDDNKHMHAKYRPEILKDVRRFEIIGESASGKTTDALESYMNGRQFDLVFIDAAHDYPGAKRDTILYKQYVKVGGYLLFHDSAHTFPGYGVHKVVWELKQDDRWEFIKEFTSKKVAPLGLALFRRKV